MASDVPRRPSLRDTWQAAGIDPRAMTVVTEDLAGGRGPVADDPMQSVPSLIEAEFELGQLLGEGGVGVVHMARQRSLARDVALKRLRSGAEDPHAIADLVREARVAGRLEHPNIVPVHSLGRAPDGAPVMVMKRVEGISWAERLNETRGRPEHLEQHLDVLLDVCQAVEFAHSRGILHRDLKPANVMLGEFGEVYVVDWGLAVAIEESDVPGLPRAADAQGVAGTPGYLAPEMAAGDGVGLDRRTDVYLLGATLHEVITGDVRHPGETSLAACFLAWESLPYEYPASVPAELGAICNRACHVDPEQRHASARELRTAIREFLRHRASLSLSSASAARLQEYLASREDGTTDASGAALSECRFGFEHALAAWPGNAEAADGLERTLVLLIERDLEAGALEAAEALLGQLASVHRGLEERVAELRAQLESRRQHVASLEAEARESDFDVGLRIRSQAALWGAVLLATVHLALGLLGSFEVYRVDHLEYVLWLSGLMTVVQIPLWKHRHAFYPNRASRQLVYSLVVMMVGASAVLLVGGMAAVSFDVSVTQALFAMAGYLGIIAVYQERRLVWVPVVVFAIAAASRLWPEGSLYFVGLVDAVVCIGAWFVWTRVADQRQ